MADRNADEATRSLRKLGFGVRADITARFATGDEPGRADLMAVRGGRSCYVEVKSGLHNFDMKNWRENQREWWQTYCKPEPFSMELWFWLGMGVDAPHLNPDKYTPRLAWLFPVATYLEVEARLKPFQDALPYLAGKGYRKEVQEQHLDAISLLEQWRLTWAGKGAWTIADTHLFAVTYVTPQPLKIINQEIAKNDIPNNDTRPNIGILSIAS